MSALAAAALLLLGPSSGREPAASAGVTGGAPVRPTALSGSELASCVWAVNSILQADLGDMLQGVPDRNAALVGRVRGFYASDPTGWSHVQSVVTALLATAAPDLFGRYDRDAKALLDGYASRIVRTCNG